MPRCRDLETILVIGSGPIVIGQACEFDYSGTQACKALREEGFRIVLINSNPATIMTDAATADKIYIEPIVPEVIEKIIAKERIDAILPTVGGQTALNVSLALKEQGILAKYGIKLIGADEKAIRRAENRETFEKIMHELGYATTPSYHIKSVAEALAILAKVQFPLVIRPSFTLGGSGGATVYNKAQYREMVENGLRLSHIHEVVVEQSIIGWKEFELEVMKDNADNTVIICSIENIDPIGIHTGDSMAVAPQQTLSDQQYQTLRNMAINIIRAIGVSTGGANIQFAINSTSGEIIVIEMNPRVSRSSALASKATGFPIAKIAAKLAVGYTLDELQNDITRSTPACFEPSIDYVVIKLPRFAFEKFSQSSPYLGIQMKSVGETMALGRTFTEAFQKAIRSLETSAPGFDGKYFAYKNIQAFSKSALQAYTQKVQQHLPQIEAAISDFHYERLLYIKDLFFLGQSVQKIARLAQIDPWFVQQFATLFHLEQQYWKSDLDKHGTTQPSPPQAALAKNNGSRRIGDFNPPHFLRTLKQNGFSDHQLAIIFHSKHYNCETAIRALRHDLNIRPVYKIVDTCAGEFAAHTPYYYSSYDEEDELTPTLSHHQRKRIAIIGGGPNRIGQGIEFDYMCVHASLELKNLGYDAVMINSNPETVSTDYDVSALLFFEPLTTEDTLEIIAAAHITGVIVHFGGQTSLNLSAALTEANIPILGTQHKAIRLSEDRKSFRKILNDIHALQPTSEAVSTYEEVTVAAERIGYPVLLRPSFVLGGRAMKVVHHPSELKTFFHAAQSASNLPVSILIDKYLEGAMEVDVDLIADGENVLICGVLEHVEEAGIHSGDSACFLPPQNIPPARMQKITQQAKNLAKRLHIIGLMNIQFALHNEQVYFLEANPRGSRTIPFVSKATGIAWVPLAVRVIMGAKLTPEDMYNDFSATQMHYVALKEAVLPFHKFPNEDPLLGPEMKSTGEVMGIGKTLAEAFYKTQQSQHFKLPSNHANAEKPLGVLISVHKKTHALLKNCQTLAQLNYRLYTTSGTHKFLSAHGIPSILVRKLAPSPNWNPPPPTPQAQPAFFTSPSSPPPPTEHDHNIAANDIVRHIVKGNINLVYNTPAGHSAEVSDAYIRLIAQKYNIGVFTTLAAIHCATEALAEYHRRKDFTPYSIQEIAHPHSQPLISPKIS